MPTPEVLDGSNVPARNDTRRMLLVRDCNATVAGGGGGLAGNGAAAAVYPSGPPGGHEGTPYVNKLTGDISWWYSGQWNP